MLSFLRALFRHVIGDTEGVHEKHDLQKGTANYATLSSAVGEELFD